MAPWRKIEGSDGSIRWTTAESDSWKEGDNVEIQSVFIDHESPYYACGDGPTVKWDVRFWEDNDVGYSEIPGMPVEAARSFALAILKACDEAECPSE